jgi:hypothetical protein
MYKNLIKFLIQPSQTLPRSLAFLKARGPGFGDNDTPFDKEDKNPPAYNIYSSKL